MAHPLVSVPAQPARSTRDDRLIELFAVYAANAAGELDAYTTDPQARTRWRATVISRLFDDPPPAGIPLAA